MHHNREATPIPRSPSGALNSCPARFKSCGRRHSLSSLLLAGETKCCCCYCYCRRFPDTSLTSTVASGHMKPSDRCVQRYQTGYACFAAFRGKHSSTAVLKHRANNLVHRPASRSQAIPKDKHQLTCARLEAALQWDLPLQMSACCKLK